MIALQEAPPYRKRCANSSIYLSEAFETEQQEWNTSIVIDIYSDTPPLSNAAIKTASKILGFRNFADNWDSYGAEKPSESAIVNALSFIRVIDAHGIPACFTAPGPNGEIVVELRKGNYEAEVYFNADNSNEVLIYEGDACISEGMLDHLLPRILELF
ncbi:MAG: hypothetical protein CV087_04220 [Candidatus Brocadia sp. WS118]|nr:MAG: hypothetical protein CV087_04220 [Candidatus Brocadia sp. WS118]